MNFDRNTITGFIVLAILFFAFFWYNNQEQIKHQKQKAEQARKDSITKANQAKTNPVIPNKDSLPANTVTSIDSNNVFIGATQGTEKLTEVDMGLIKVAFTNKGGQPKWVELKKFKAPDSTNVKLGASAFDKIDYKINSGSNKEKFDSISGFYFSGGEPIKNADGSVSVNFQLQSADGRSLVHQFVVRPDNYMMDFTIRVNGGDRLFSNNTMFLTWRNKASQLQKDLDYERTQSQICFNMDNDYDYYNIASRTEKEFTDPVKWISVKQQFFNTAIVAQKGNFSSGRVEWIVPKDGSIVVQAIADLRYPLPSSGEVTVPLGIYYGPTDYKILKQYGNDMEDMVNLGSGMFAFVKYINRWIVIPVFDFFSKLTSNYGIVILLLTLFIRLLTSPLMYPGYLTSAKMKVLRPELEQLKVKYPDQQQYAMEQMKFTREAGVNQFAGCLPGLLQIPIFFALYSFFNTSVALRGQKFLWANDLSQYDSVFHLPFNIPFYGDHVSLFTITAVITSFLISLYSMSMAPDQSNPVLKYMPYFFPIILLFIFNRLPSGLTWYYTVSNIITLVLQFVIQNYIINHDKILAKIEENRKKPKKQSNWQKRLAEMQEQQRQMKEAQNKNRR